MPRKRGDTIIEVILAVSLFSLVAIGALTLMNHGIAIAQRSLEVTQVRQQIDAQAEMIRFVHDRAKEDTLHGPYATLWQRAKNNLVTTPHQFIGMTTCFTDPAQYVASRMFALVPPSASTGLTSWSETFATPATYAKINTDTTPAQAEGLAVQLVRVSGGGAYDVYIQACWNSPGSSLPITLGTIVRLYDAEA